MSILGKKAAFAAIWVLLFVGTITINSIMSDDGARAESQSPLSDLVETNVKRATRATLFTIPKLSGETALASLESYPVLDESFPQMVKDHNEDIYQCARKTIGESRLRTQYFEISFTTIDSESLRPDGATEHRVVVADVGIERSTIEFSSEEKWCLKKVFERFVVIGDTSPPTQRFGYTMCINRRER